MSDTATVAPKKPARKTAPKKAAPKKAKETLKLKDNPDGTVRQALARSIKRMEEQSKAVNEFGNASAEAARATRSLASAFSASFSGDNAAMFVGLPKTVRTDGKYKMPRQEKRQRAMGEIARLNLEIRTINRKLRMQERSRRTLKAVKECYETGTLRKVAAE
jgi:hypothetical protein